MAEPAEAQDTGQGAGSDTYQKYRDELNVIGHQLIELAGQLGALDAARIRTFGNQITELAGRVQFHRPPTTRKPAAPPEPRSEQGGQPAKKAAAAAAAPPRAAPPAPTWRPRTGSPGVDDARLVAVVESIDVADVRERIERSSGLRTAAEIADFLAQEVTAKQIENQAALDPMIKPDGGRYSVYAAKRIAAALGVAYPKPKPKEEDEPEE